MSDIAPTEAQQRRMLERCTGGHGCPCGGCSSRRASGTPSPSRSRTPPNGEDVSEGSSDDSIASSDSESESGSETPVFHSVPVQEWDGLENLTIKECNHGYMCIMRNRWGGQDSGRRFLGCPLEEEDEQCDFVYWLDKPWPARVQATMSALWYVLKHSLREAAAVRESLTEAERQKEIASKRADELKEAAARTKRVAERVCAEYHTKTIYAVADKSKLMYALYCLVGFVIFLAATLFYKM